MRLEGSVVVITGASSGIGAATAKHLAARGAAVALFARREPEMQAVARDITQAGGRAHVVPGDVTNGEHVRHLIQSTLDAFGRIDALVNNAGTGGGLNLCDTRDDLLKQVLDVNVLGCALCAKYALPHLSPGGVIVNIGSVAGEVATVGMYTASKFALRGFNDALRREVKGRGLRVVLVAPGFIRTEMTAGLRYRMPGPEIVARAIEKAIRSPRRKIVVPWWYRPLMYLGKIPLIADAIFSNPKTQARYRDRDSVKRLTT
ncbi:MAG: SDR family NAD(P)-dependent oxidoreductase [Chloracidobacterium sp.]|uniref:SDR family NAD(P)-dependent oxidoreductase n=1 Tax=Chloracidobacterium validum TaxID=2821543 RepID=A0ABX8BC69_9BACT|nr:SDR family NAD(P)-dependent oxidoreductase [Chloracidobacterium validum]QUW03621.1 SDR family NAD(P)-dependent oxidoreductase [Chloracidobacterium validum]